MATSFDRLEVTACRHDRRLRAFIEERISSNAWPIHSRPLRRLIDGTGLDLEEADRLEVPLDALARLMRRICRASRRVEHALSLDNPFHTTLHNFDVALRLLQLEWPLARPMPEHLRRATERVYDSYEEIEPVILDLARRLLDDGLPSWRLARDLLAACGHDYGHTGGTERLDDRGSPTPLTHEETAEKHVAKFGIDLGLPPVLILESLGAIRATTVHIRPGRAKVWPATDFERRLALADVAGCVKRPDLWMTRVAIPVLRERIAPWKRRRIEIPAEISALRRQLAVGRNGTGLRERIEALEAEQDAIITTVSQAFEAELRFLIFTRDQRLQQVASGLRLWADTIDHRIGLIRRLLDRKQLLAPLDAEGFHYALEARRDRLCVESRRAAE